MEPDILHLQSLLGPPPVANPPPPPESPGQKSDNQHAQSDVDSSNQSQHHTLGIGPNQSSSGIHIHDGQNSKLLTNQSLQEFVNGFTLYTPVWSSGAATQPTIGNGFLRGRYFRFGPFCYVEMYWEFGSTSTLGLAGIYMWSLPIPVSASTVIAGTILPAVVNQGTSRWPATAMVFTSSTKIDRVIPSTLTTTGTAGLGDTGHKAAWAAGDYVKVAGWYPVD